MRKEEIITDEVNEIFRSRFDFINRHYPAIREAYQNYYEWPELDPLRHEICLCIMFGLCQAAITLTNHLLESLLKYALIINKGQKHKQTEDDIKGQVITSLMDKYAEGINLYGGAILNKTINLAHKEGLISKEQKIRLHEFREIFRNAYGHSDKLKTFGKSTMPVTAVKLENDRIVQDESSEPEIVNLLIGQGIVQAEMAQDTATPYFLYIDNLAREIYVKLFGSDEIEE